LQRFSSLASREAVWRRASAAARRIFAAHNGAAEWICARRQWKARQKFLRPKGGHDKV